MRGNSNDRSNAAATRFRRRSERDEPRGKRGMKRVAKAIARSVVVFLIWVAGAIAIFAAVMATKQEVLHLGDQAFVSDNAERF
jgi:hypothetical protein